MMSITEKIEPELWTVRRVAQALGCAERTVWRMRDSGRMPLAIKLGGSVKWRRKEILSWIEQGCPKPRRAAR